MIKEFLNKFIIKIKSVPEGNFLFEQLISKNKFVKIFTNICAAVVLKRLISKCKTLENYINLAFSFEYCLIKGISCIVNLFPSQKKLEVIEFIKLIAKNRPKIILEIGTSRGGTLFLLSRFSNSNTLIISVDLPGGEFGSGYPRSKIPFYKSFASNKQKIILIRRDSHKFSTLQKVKKILKEKKVDFLYIDGDHSYNGVKKDFEMYSALVKRNGIIAFHDIVEHPSEMNVGVNKFWKEIKENYKYKEFVEDWNQKWAGIGILFTD